MTQMVLYTVYKNCKKVSEEKVISDSITIVVVPDHQIIKEKEVEIPSHEGDHEQNKGTAVTNDEENVITKSTVAA